LFPPRSSRATVRAISVIASARRPSAINFSAKLAATGPNCTDELV